MTGRTRTLTLAVALTIGLAAGVVAHAASLGVTTETITAFDRGGPVAAGPAPTALAFTFSGTRYKIDNGDTVAVTFDSELKPSTVCSAFADGGPVATWTKSTTLTVTNNTNVDGGPSDVLQLASGTGCNFGTVRLGHTGFVTQDVTFTSSTIALSADKKTITITIGSTTSTKVDVNQQNVTAKYAASSSISGTTGVAASGTASHTGEHF